MIEEASLCWRKPTKWVSLELKIMRTRLCLFVFVLGCAHVCKNTVCRFQTFLHTVYLVSVPDKIQGNVAHCWQACSESRAPGYSPALGDQDVLSGSRGGNLWIAKLTFAAIHWDSNSYPLAKELLRIVMISFLNPLSCEPCKPDKPKAPASDIPHPCTAPGKGSCSVTP